MHQNRGIQLELLEKNTLVKMVKEVCVKANIPGHKMNHSLRATGIFDLFQAGVPDMIIQDLSGHLSMDGLRQYQRTSEQEEDVSKVLASGCSIQKSHHSLMQRPYYSPVQNVSDCNVTIYNAPSSQSK